MSMSTHVIGFRPADEKWKKMKAVWDACEKADTSIPKEVVKFFNDSEPDERGIETSIEEAVKEWGNESSQGFEVEISKLPKNITHIRFYNSW